VAVAASHCKGAVARDISTHDVQAQWRKSLLGIEYNSAFYDRAQGAGWVDPTGKKGMFHLTQSGLDNLEALAPELTAGELKKSGTLIIVNRKATHTFDKFLRTTLAAAKKEVLVADSWVDETIFDTVLDVIPKNCTIKIICAKPRGAYDTRAKRFAREYPNVSDHLNPSFFEPRTRKTAEYPSSVSGKANNSTGSVSCVTDKGPRSILPSRLPSRTPPFGKLVTPAGSRQKGHSRSAAGSNSSIRAADGPTSV
jgi:hypothetical protein